MEISILKILLALSFAVFFVDKKFQYYIMLFLQFAVTVITTIWAVSVFMPSQQDLTINFINAFGSNINFEIDKLTAFFILVINFTMLTGSLYAKGYLKPYLDKKSRLEFSMHYFNLFWLYASMLLVSMIRDGLAFLFVWELMSLSSFFLVIFESEKKETITAGIKYLIQMHIGFIFILLGFLIAYTATTSNFGFNGLETYFIGHQPFPLFILFFIGFGIKAGFIPFHTWLPHAHPAAPSHVSGIMSGVMIKLGIYGILRVLTYIHTDLLGIGIFILIISLISGILGVTMAIAQHDIKKLLAYHSIENIGIIGIGIGLGVVGLAVNIPILAALGFAGGLLHILNHSLFKSMLFYGAGSIYQQTHTRNIEQMGGLIKKMPKTAILFLLGSLAISGLPPFNGFVSEFLIYSGMFKGLMLGDLHIDMLLFVSFLGLVLIGGLALFCFTKVFSIVFLGTSRSEKTLHSKEVEPSMLFPSWMIGVLIIAIGLMPFFIMPYLNNLVMLFTSNAMIPITINSVFINISIATIIFILIVVLLWFLRSRQQGKVDIEKGPTWGCGYSGANAALHQYTATSYADNLKEYSNVVMNIKTDKIIFEEEEIFPSAKTFHSHSTDIFEDNLISKPTNILLFWLEKLAIFQTGKLQHYILYSLVFLLIIFFLTLFNAI